MNVLRVSGECLPVRGRKFLLGPRLVTLVCRSHALAGVIFFLTSLFIDSIHSISVQLKTVA